MFSQCSLQRAHNLRFNLRYVRLTFKLHNKFASLTTLFFQRGRFPLFPITSSLCVRPFSSPVHAQIPRQASNIRARPNCLQNLTRGSAHNYAAASILLVVTRPTGAQPTVALFYDHLSSLPRSFPIYLALTLKLFYVLVHLLLSFPPYPTNVALS